MRAPLIIVGLFTILLCACESVPPTASFTSATVLPRGGLTSVESPNWCGYSLPMQGITGIRATWNQPAVSGPPTAQMVAWIGIGGWDYTYNNIVQVGTSAYVDTHTVMYDAWYETLPPNQFQFASSFSVRPGDRISAEIDLVQTHPQTWRMTLRDASQHEPPFVVTKAFPSMQAYADFIVEDPDATSNNGPPYSPFPAFAPVTFTHADVRYASDWQPLAALPALRITLNQNTAVLSSPGDISGADAFRCSET